ncbi:MAG: MBL fold metallo-hydrolase [Microgenomates group bacterium]|nr:MBL fold metallo-hydrolase [Microgenomates group bacterium]
MDQNFISKKTFIVVLFVSAIFVFFIFLINYLKTETKLVFCDVGQGDAAYIRIINQIDILVDAGPDRKILNCLGKYMPFYDRKIELILLSHHQKDHFGGLDYLIDRYKIDEIIFPSVENQLSNSFSKLTNKIKKNHIKTRIFQAGDQISLATASFLFLWPRMSFLKKFNLNKDDNNFSLIFLFQIGKKKVLFTGDASPLALDQIVLQMRKNNKLDLKNLYILKIPHHGSKNGLTKKFLRLANPIVGVISVGKNNSFGHPSKEVLNMLKAQNVKILRTDEIGHIVFVF